MTINDKNFEAELERFRNLTRRVQRRIFYREALDALLANFILTFAIAIPAGLLLSRLDRMPETPFPFIIATFGIALIATAAGLFATPRDRFAAEKAIDRRYNLEDRCLTASDTLSQATDRETTAAETAQLRDCFAKSAGATAREVVSLAPRRAKARAFAIVALGLVLTLAAFRPFEDAASAAAPNETVLDVAAELRESIMPEIDKILREAPENENLRALGVELKKLTAELEANVGDPKKGASLVAQMERAVRDAISSSGVEAADAALKELGAALAGVESTSSIARAFVEGDYDKAADELEALDFEKMSARDRQALANKLKAAAEIIRSRKDEQTAALTEQLAAELQAGQCASCKNTACKLANRFRTQKKTKEAAKRLDCQLARLGLCKSNCAGACATCEQTGGANASKGKESGSPNGDGQGNRSGSAKSGERGLTSDLATDPLGGKDEKLDSTRETTRASGRESADGESTRERGRSNEAVGFESSRERDEADREYSRRVESALDEDALPPARRRAARAYFETLRDESVGELPAGRE